MTKSYILTKSKYIRGLQCVKAMYLDVYHPKLARYSPETLAKFRQGRAFERTFKGTFPDVVDISQRLRMRMDQYPVLTASLLQQEGPVTLFEAGFLYDGVLVLADVLHKQPDGSVVIYEVKNSGAVSDTFAHDVAIQHYVISHALADISDLFHDALRLTQFNLLYHDDEGHFIPQNLTARARSLADDIPARLSRFKALLREKEEPAVAPSAHCDTPYECPYKRHCLSSAKTWLTQLDCE
ncbi:MAG: hypothetical protein MJZ77_08125 [Bacteroidales bacterium]|nr:hypothetical protein [Bacteroidales bacterium]